VPLPVEREIIHSIVRDFSVDGTSGVSRPLGMSGRRLDVLLHVVTGMSTVIANARRCVESAGVEVQAQILEPIATARAVLTDAERDIGVLIVDIGGGTTDIAVFIDNAICHTAAVPLAGDRVTRDIAEVLRVSRADAEALKCRFGAALPSLVPEGDLVHVSKADGLDFDRVPRRLIAEIIQARLTEVFSMVKQEVMRAPVPKIGGIVLSGGGSQAPGISRLAGDVFDGIAVRTSEPRNVTGSAHLVSSPIYATGVGLAMIAAEEGLSAVATERAVGGTAASVRSWIGDTWDRLLSLKPW
jgi:cell division protein FtsA